MFFLRGDGPSIQFPLFSSVWMTGESSSSAFLAQVGCVTLSCGGVLFTPSALDFALFWKFMLHNILCHTPCL